MERRLTKDGQLSRRRVLSLAGAVASPAIPRLVRGNVASAAEAAEIRIAVQFGIVYLPLLVIQEQRLIEAVARDSGLPPPTVSWLKFSGGAAMNDAVISGSLDMGAAGVPPVLTVWDRTRGTMGIKAVAPLASVPSWLLTNRPEVATVRDFGPDDRIAVPSAKVSFQAIMLQMAAEQAFGESEFARLDPLTVSLDHPDATTALMGGHAAITAHFSNPPFQQEELAHPGVHRVLSSYDILGGPHSSALLYATSRFRDANPHLVAAVIGALERADAFIAGNPRAAAELYIRSEGSHLSADFVEGLLRDTTNRFTTEPENIMTFAKFQHHTGQIKVSPAEWRDVFFPELTAKAGS